MNKEQETIISRLSTLLREQDARMTADPLYLVQQRNRIWLGEDAPNNGDYTWVADGGCEVVDSDILECLWKMYDEDSEDEQTLGADHPAEWAGTYTKHAFIDVWDFVTVCLTQEGADNYIRDNAHNLVEPRVYVASAYRNPEMQAVRNHFLERAPLTVDDPCFSKLMAFLDAQRPALAARIRAQVTANMLEYAWFNHKDKQGNIDRDSIRKKMDDHTAPADAFSALFVWGQSPDLGVSDYNALQKDFPSWDVGGQADAE